MRAGVAVAALLLFTAGPCFAQSIVAGASVTTAISGDRTGHALGATFGVQITPRWRVAFEIAHAPKLDPQFFHIVNASTNDDDWTDVTAYLGTIRADLRPGQRWSPFVTAGVGAARVTDVFYVVYIAPGPNPLRSRSTRPAGRAGGGISFKVLPWMAVDLEASWLGISTDPHRHLGRFGGALSYSF
jgi:opacity protein-like surface antigen